MLDRLAYIALGGLIAHILAKREEPSDFEAMLEHLSPTLVNAIHAELAGEPMLIVSYDA